MDKMELNKNDENSFDPTPKLKSSPIPITFVPFNQNDGKCSYCGEKYTETVLSDYWWQRQKYCKRCLSRYITDITDNDTYLDVYYAMKLECNEHEISRTKEPRNIQECCTNCLEILLFKQTPVYDLFTSNVIEGEKYCKLCGKLYQEIGDKCEFKLCSDCYRISFRLTELTLTKKHVLTIYLPWWDNSFDLLLANQN
ncbi:hypothetical protein C1645_848240 [Glomus cerebriforme]|uniref:Uncharacterized protein n=1 Tax=Glomus cerebriforme TaxID=658196 RepID=A0A397SYR0_9GLOM|nr:hypothetical protein C1645_848240 [Glomus cerebriforme]